MSRTVVAGLLLTTSCWHSHVPSADKPVNDPDSSLTIPGGVYTVGCESMSVCQSNPLRTVSVATFQIDRTVVLEHEYQRCRLAGICQAVSRAMRWNDGEIGDPSEAVMLDVNGAIAFCAWRGGQLPSSVEWEVAGRGTTGNLYPWGNDWNPDHISSSTGIRRFMDISEEYPRAGTRPDLSSVFGVEDMSGLAPEFVRSASGYLIRNASVSLDRRGPPTGEDYMLVTVSTPLRFQRGVFRCVYRADP